MAARSSKIMNGISEWRFDQIAKLLRKHIASN